MADFASYDPSAVQMNFAGIILGGFQNGTFIEAERAADGFQMHVGSLGDVTRTRSLNRTGHVTFTLMAQSPYNDLLQALVDADEASGTGVGTLSILDNNTVGDADGPAEVHASKAWIRKRPKWDRAQESGSVTWTLDCADMELNSSGNVTSNA